MKTALITGASSGIGMEFAKLLAAEKNNLVLVARRKDRLTALKKELEKFNVNITIITGDLSKKETPLQIKKALEKENVKIDLLINNSGFGDVKAFKDADPKKLESMIEVNVTALTKMSHIFLQDIIRSSGGIINVASVAGFIPGPYMAVYYATKAYVISFTEALAHELKDKGVKVSALCPGPVKTEFGKVAGMKGDSITKGKIPGPKEVAKYGYENYKKGKVVVVHGFAMKTMKNLTRILPRKTTTNMVGKLHSKQKKVK